MTILVIMRIIQTTKAMLNRDDADANADYAGDQDASAPQPFWLKARVSPLPLARSCLQGFGPTLALAKVHIRVVWLVWWWWLRALALPAAPLLALS